MAFKEPIKKEPLNISRRNVIVGAAAVGVLGMPSRSNAITRTGYDVAKITSFVDGQLTEENRSIFQAFRANDTGWLTRHMAEKGYSELCVDVVFNASRDRAGNMEPKIVVHVGYYIENNPSHESTEVLLEKLTEGGLMGAEAVETFVDGFRNHGFAMVGRAKAFSANVERSASIGLSLEGGVWTPTEIAKDMADAGVTHYEPLGDEFRGGGALRNNWFKLTLTDPNRAFGQMAVALFGSLLGGLPQGVVESSNR